ncbi:MAG: DegT/DnrJ/EryC1/StrS family aminotransferase [Brevinematales bacterium]|nr:DegT/DnrJ/EryC1/StrS family aminotransferase [Brevinematales bacterium]
MNVPLLDLKREYKLIREKVLRDIEEIFENQAFILGKYVNLLENRLKSYLGVEDVIGVSSGTDALLISLMAIDIKLGDEVIVPSFTFYATASSVSRLGAKPVFADIDLETYNIMPDEIEKKISSKTKAIIPVHLYGNPAKIDTIINIANSRNIAVIEDNAQSLGAEYDGKKTGTFGLFGCISFYPTKNLGGAGDGGAISTNDIQLAKKVRMLRVHGSEKRYYHDYIGVNGRLDEIQASYINNRLDRIEQNNQERISIASKYNSLLKTLEEKELLFTPRSTDSSKHIYHQYTIRIPNYRDKLREYLTGKGIGTEIYYPLPLHLQKCFSELGYKEGDLPNTEKASKEVLSLPIFPGLTDEEIDYVVQTIMDFFRSI